MKKIITLLVLTFIVSYAFAQYTPMTAAGYQFKRILCDSTLHIPSFCGIPTLRNSTAKNGAIAMDTCNYKIYMWTNAGGWGEIIGAGTDTTSLSLRIDQRVKYTDTASMLSKYLRIIDTTNKFVANVIKVNDSIIRVFKGNTITDLKILGKGTDTTSLSNRIDARVKYTDTAAMLLPYLRKVDTTAMLSKYLRKTDTASLSNRINLKLNISDTATMLSKYLRKTDTTNRFVNAVTKVNDSTIRVFKGSTSTDIELPRGSGGGGGGTGTVYNVSTGYALSGGPINTTGTIIVDSAVLSTKYLRRADTSNLVATKSNLALKLNISDTAAMLSKYLRKVDTLSLSNRINLKLNIADTSNKWVNNVTKINDTAIRVWKGTTSSVISLAKDVVYTQSPIMSKISNDSNIIYFNADTANVWRGGGGATPNLQQVTDVVPNGNKTTNSIYANRYYVYNADSDAYGNLQLNTNEQWRLVNSDGNVGATFEQGNISFRNANTFYWSFISDNITNNKQFYIPNYSSINPIETLPISVNGNFADAQGNITISGGGGGGTVTDISQGYGITASPTNPITVSGTITVDTSVSGLSGKYVRISDTATMLLPYLFGLGTTNYVPKFSTTRQLAISQIYDNGTSVGINTASPNASYKLDVNGIISTNNGINISPSTITKTGIYGSSNTMEFWSGNNKIASYALATIGTALYDFPFTLNFGSNASGSVSGMHLATSVTPNGNNSVDFNQLLINPSYNQTPVAGIGTGVLRGIYYNPTLTALGTSKHIAFQSTSGDIIFNKLKTSSSTSDSIAIFVNDTLKKAPYPTVAGVSSGYYGAFEDNTSQTAASINTAYPVKFNTTDLTNGVSIVNDGSSNPTRVTLANTGIYNIQFSLQLEKTGGSGNMIADIWIRKNGVDIPSTTGKVVLTGSANASPVVAAWNYVLDLAAGDYVQLMWATSNTNVEIVAAAATSPHPAIPSSILTVTQQSGIMAGTGITAINSLIGAAQTMVTGTDSTDFKIVSTGTSHKFNLPTASATNRGALSSANWTTFNNKIGAADTSVFQRKSISSYTMLANNTNATGNATAQTFRDTAGTYAGTITWTGTAPTTQTINAYQWQQTGKMVRLQIFGYYTNAGSALTSVSLTIPADCPAPDISMFTSGALAILYQGIGGLGLSNTSLTTTTNAYMRRNAANNGNELLISAASANYRRYQIDITYRAQ
jgi:hypothetical protein